MNTTFRNTADSLSVVSLDVDATPKPIIIINNYADIEGRYVFEPIAIETLGVLSTSARQLMSLLGMRIAQVSGEAIETSFLFQHCSVLVQSFNAVLLHDSLTVIDCTV